MTQEGTADPSHEDTKSNMTREGTADPSHEE
eukprot:CAMPEP_0181129816 /NCGR_PEP_ID=MMETSP1071-20121207/29527_1 /TAXON_ID=35127 /ORGANISM="Thalassiosira sp., Strain NH16" /LENGTH=30 /DNA_ID= /DNA_START= /DNA_END= /DNA_ORIENTATION=